LSKHGVFLNGLSFCVYLTGRALCQGVKTGESSKTNVFGCQVQQRMRLDPDVAWMERSGIQE